MNNTIKDVPVDRYSSRNTRGFLRMLVNDPEGDIKRYSDQFYASKNYQGRLEAVKYLITLDRQVRVPRKIFKDALRDFCSQVKVEVLKSFSFESSDDAEFLEILADIARNDEKMQLRAMALEKLSELDATSHYDLFFSTSLLKSSKESAAGLLGLYKLDREKAYQMAKFRAGNCSGNLDLAIGEVFSTEGSASDLKFFKDRLEARSKFHKIELAKIYLRTLGRLADQEVLKTHLLFISKNISGTGNTELIQLLIMELHQFISEYKNFLQENSEAAKLVTATISQLLEKDYNKGQTTDPFGPL